VYVFSFFHSCVSEMHNRSYDMNLHTSTEEINLGNNIRYFHNVLGFSLKTGHHLCCLKFLMAVFILLRQISEYCL
jgi:hypothetical protein